MNMQNQEVSQSMITTKELYHEIDNPEVILIDIRPIDAYNGWKLKDEPRGGHIKGAKSLPYKWSEYIDWIEIVRSKHIIPKHKVIIYGYDVSKIQRILALFHRAGYTNVQGYPEFLSDWVQNDQYPMDRLNRYQHLVSAEWVHHLIQTGSAPDYDNHKYVICHAHYQNPAAYTQGHIPEAIALDTNLIESSDTWNRRNPEELDHTFQQLGIDGDTTVILYGRFSHPDNADAFPGSSAGHLGAMRCAFIMLYAGVKDIRILNGGLQSWFDAGYETTTKDYFPTPIPDFKASIPQHPEYAVDLTEAKEILSAPNKNLVSVRSRREYIGEVSGYNYIEKKGRIPGSIFGSCGSDAYHMENYRNLDHTTREYHEIEHMWKQVGITPEKHNSFYCGTGWRGSEAFINAWLMGWKNISVFDGGWFEWSNNNYPFETGIPSETKSPQIVEGYYP